MMNGDSTTYGARPQNGMQAGMQQISYAAPGAAFQGDKKNYVFVDEHNRHKRLKVMRACEGCRKRKIKCDGATTSTWPCGSCTRLKQKCHPPVVNLDRAVSGGGHLAGLERVLNFDEDSGSGDDDEYAYIGNDASLYEDLGTTESLQLAQQQFNTNMGQFSSPPFTENINGHQDYAFTQMPSTNLNLPHTPYQETTNFMSSSASVAPSDTSNWSSEHFSPPPGDISDALGDLKINDSGVAPYIADQRKQLAESPAYEEPEAKLPPNSANAGSVRIPPALMPSDQQCQELFRIFFTEIHPYVPVISRPYFEQQWRTNRGSISPLILEAIFACAGRMSDDASEGASWLALAARHEDCFMDVPRLSTVQALLLLLKARESAPKRGYYYRSWMTVKKLVSMALDLELDQHYSLHQTPGLKCNSDPTECLVKTRIWQNIFICEIMVGGPQGRRDMGVDPSTVDLEIHRPMPGIDSTDYQISRQFTYLVRKIHYVRVLHDLKGNAKDGPTSDWASDPKFISTISDLAKWQRELPRDLQVHFAEDDAPPFLSSHFIGNMHAYYYLTVTMLHRPSLMAPSSYADGSFKRHLSSCYDAAKKMCKLHEAIYQKFGIPGLICMQRGINFVIYSVLTCTVVHLVAITSPDPEFNIDSKDYFTRHMRILEICTSAWPQPEMQTQIDALRDAFSVDTSKPFQLKPSFPFGSPAATQFHPSPPLDPSYQQPMVPRQSSFTQVPHGSYPNQPMTPPVSAGLPEPRESPVPAASSSMLSNGLSSMPMGMAGTADQWNPTPIFQTYNNAFGPNSASMVALSTSLPQQSPPLFPPTTMMSPMQLPPNVQGQQQQYNIPQNMPQLQRTNTGSQMPLFGANGAPSAASANMWTDSVARTLDSGGMKRRWDGNNMSSYLGDQSAPKRPR